MNKQEAQEYINWHKAKEAEYHYLASFTSSRPFVIDYPDAYNKLREAKIVLGTFQWQRTYEEITRQFPNITKEKYNEYRRKYGFKEIKI